MKRKRKVHHYFVPSKYNNFKPYLLRLETTIVLAFVVAGFFVITQSFGNIMRTGSIVNSAAVVASVLADLANADRTQSGVGNLAYSPRLAAVAQMKANDMAQKSYFSHNAPDGTEPWIWFEEAGYGFSHAGENLAVFFSDSVEVEKAWMNSPTHRENILNGKFTEVGIALAEGLYQGRPTTFVVQMFGTPAYAAAPIEEPESVAVVSEQVDAPGEPRAAPKKVATKQPIITAKTETFIAVEREPAQVAGTSTDEFTATATAPVITSIVPSKPTLTALTWKYLTSPRTVLSWIYFWLSVIVIFAMLLIVVVETERKHWMGMVYGGGLLVFMVALTVLQHWYFAGQLLII